MIDVRLGLFRDWQDGLDQSGSQALTSDPLPWADMANQSQTLS